MASTWTRHPHPDEECLTCVDVAWLASWGVGKEQAAQRLDYSEWSALRRHVNNCGQTVWPWESAVNQYV